MASLALVVGWACATLLADEGNPSVDEFCFAGRLSSLSEPAEFVGKGWTGPSGLVIDDVGCTSSTSEWEPEAKKAVDELLTVIRPKRVKAVAEFNYMRLKEFPLQIITLRIFVYETADDARAWWREKYEMEGWQKYYKKVEGVGDNAVDGTQLPKRIVRIGDCILACHQLHKNDDYLRVLARYIKKLTAKGPTEKKKA